MPGTFDFKAAMDAFYADIALYNTQMRSYQAEAEARIRAAEYRRNQVPQLKQVFTIYELESGYVAEIDAGKGISIARESFKDCVDAAHAEVVRRAAVPEDTKPAAEVGQAIEADPPIMKVRAPLFPSPPTTSVRELMELMDAIPPTPPDVMNVPASAIGKIKKYLMP